MKIYSAPAILLDVFDLHDKDRVVTLLTAEHGKKRGVAPGARRKYSRFSGRLQPLAKVDVTWTEKDSWELVRISDIELVRPPTALQSTLEGILMGAYLADHMMVFAQENEASEHSFRLLDTSIEALLAEIDGALVGRYFEVWVLRLAGIFPPPRECPVCGRAFGPEEPAVLAAEDDALVCRECAGASPAENVVLPEALDFLRRTARESLPRMAQRPPSRRALAAVESLTGRIRRSFLGRELNSYEVMRRTLGNVPGE